ncbi:MAG: hypothetical protein HUU20_12600 [Pirellulales bacterium]|nr:hypothetical protein [Pirellulales bacterium]
MLETEDLAELMADARRMSRSPEAPSDPLSCAARFIQEFPKFGRIKLARFIHLSQRAFLLARNKTRKLREAQCGTSLPDVSSPSPHNSSSRTQAPPGHALSCRLRLLFLFGPNEFHNPKIA